MNEEKDEILEGAIRALAQAQTVLAQRGECYNHFKVDAYMLKPPGDSDNLAGYMQMVHLKTLRTFSCLHTFQREQAMDSLLDLINYAAFLYARVKIDQHQVSLNEHPFRGVEFVPKLGWKKAEAMVPGRDGDLQKFSLFLTPSEETDNVHNYKNPVLYGDKVTVRQDSTGYTTTVDLRWRSTFTEEDLYPALKATAQTAGWQKGDVPDAR